MTAASFWSLLAPAFEIAEQQTHLAHTWSFFLIVLGFILGALFVYMTDLLLPSITSNQVFHCISNEKRGTGLNRSNSDNQLTNLNINSNIRSRLKRNRDNPQIDKIQLPIGDTPMNEVSDSNWSDPERNKWHRLLLLIIAVTVHNFPGIIRSKIKTMNNRFADD